MTENGRRGTQYDSQRGCLLDLEQACVEDIMVPAAEIVGIDLDQPWSKLLEQLETAQHTRIPLYRTSMDNLIGIVHLRSVLQAGVPPEVANELLASEAEALERCARDMRMYALKHDAIRRELVTEEERNAYYRGLAWVAGEQTIARPWTTER